MHTLASQRRISHDQITSLVLGCLLIASSCGCSQVLTHPQTWFENQPEYASPQQAVAIWSDTVLHQAGQRAQRGCGGRLMFYTSDHTQAVRVDGSLVVYVWDDSTDSMRRKPDRKFVFRTDDFQKHYSTSKVGHSYSFWIPWDEPGGPRTTLTLISRFIGRNGAEVTSSPSKVILPGVVETSEEYERKLQARLPRPDSPHTQSDHQQIQQLSFETRSAPMDDSATHGIRTTEIPLTSGFLQRNLSALSEQDRFEDAPREFQAVNAEPYSHHQANTSSPQLGFTEEAEPSGQSLTRRPQPDHSLRFSHRVQTSREAQRSVGHALSERYQSKKRIPPWEKY